MTAPECCVAIAMGLAVAGLLPATGCEKEATPPAQAPTAAFTWVTNTTWLMEVAGLRILHDAFITRVEAPSFDLSEPETLRFPLMNPDTALVRDVLSALGAEDGISHILAGHGHVDHTLDLGLIAGMTGAEIIGSRTVCFQALAQGMEEGHCQVAEGGEVLSLAPGLTVRVIRWSHSGDPSDPRFRLIQPPMELKGVPEVDPETGGLDSSVDGAFPNGGGIRAFLFHYETPQGALRWLISNSGNPLTFDGESTADPEFFESLGLSLENLELVEAEGTPREWLVRALEEDGRGDVHLWLATGPSAHVRQVTEYLRPAALIPHHWGGFGGEYSAGVPRAYDNPALRSFLDSLGVSYLPPTQYLDRFTLTLSGIDRDPNTDVKRRLGFPPGGEGQ